MQEVKNANLLSNITSKNYENTKQQVEDRNRALAEGIVINL